MSGSCAISEHCDPEIPLSSRSFGLRSLVPALGFERLTQLLGGKRSSPSRLSTI